MSTRVSEEETTVSKADLVEGLNVDLGFEYQAVLMYTTYAAMSTGIHRPLLKAFFEDEIAEELQHAQYLANKITALGGTPVTEATDFELARKPEEMLQQILEAESKTVQRYARRREQAEAFGDHGLANDLDDIISDETRHKEETEKLLRGLDEA